MYYRTLIELGAYFLRLGLTAFGGPAAHIALMEEDCVRRRQWISRERFVDVLGAANLIPGPTSTELAMHIGHARAGWPGLLVAGVSFILPAAAVVAAIAVAYVRAGSLPAIEGVLRAVKPAAVVVILFALISLARTAVRSARLALTAGAAALLAWAGVHELAVLLFAGLASVAVALLPAGTAMSVALLPEVFFYFAKTGSLLFGSGYVLFAILRGDLVDRARWITEAQLLDAIAVGQVTPGPVFTAATFIGYLVAGGPGAVVATAGMFLPAFVFAAISVSALERFRDNRLFRAFLDGVNSAAVALIALVLTALARHALVDVRTVAIAVAATVLVGWLRVNSAWVILGSAAAGLLA